MMLFNLAVAVGVKTIQTYTRAQESKMDVELQPNPRLAVSVDAPVSVMDHVYESLQKPEVLHSMVGCLPGRNPAVSGCHRFPVRQR
jgi:hypothetical protein